MIIALMEGLYSSGFSSLTYFFLRVYYGSVGALREGMTLRQCRFKFFNPIKKRRCFQI